MRIRLTTDRAAHGLTQYEGETVDLPEEEAHQLLTAGQAERLPPRKSTRETGSREPQASAESAAKRAPENAARR